LRVFIELKVHYLFEIINLSSLFTGAGGFYGTQKY